MVMDELPGNKSALIQAQLCKSLQHLGSILSTDWNELEEKDVMEKLLNITELMEAAKIDVFMINERLQQSSTDLKDEIESETIYSIEQQEYLCQILEFIVHHGLITHLDFQISILLPKSESYNRCKLAMQDILDISRKLFSCGTDKTMRRILVSKHLLSLLASFVQLGYSPSCAKLLSPDEIAFSRKCLSNLIVKWSQLKEAVKCLFIMQGSSSRANPAWVNKTCGMLLSKCLLRQNGVHAVIYALLNTLVSDIGTWKKVEIASRILSTPSHLSSEEAYYANICKQIRELFQLHCEKNSMVSDIDSEKILVHILVATVHSLHKRSPYLTAQYFFKEIFFWLGRFYVNSSHKEENETSEKFSNTIMCIEISHMVFVVFQHPHLQETIQKALLPHFNALFALYCWSRDRVNHIRTLVKELVIECLKACDGDVAACLLLSQCGIVDESVKKLLEAVHKLKPDLIFVCDGTNEITMEKRKDSRSPEDVIDRQNKKVAAVMEIASASHINKILSQIFILLCKHIEILSQVSNFKENSNKLMSTEEAAALHLEHGESQLLAYALLTTLLEENDPKNLLDGIEQITSFVKVLLNKVYSSSDPKHPDTDIESLKLCYAVLGLCLLDGEAAGRSDSLRSLVPLLQKLSTSDNLSSEDKEMASDLAVAIATHGACSDVSMEEFSQTMQEQLRNLEEKFSEQQSLKPESSNLQQAYKSSQNDVVEERGDTVSTNTSKTLSTNVDKMPNSKSSIPESQALHSKIETNKQTGLDSNATVGQNNRKDSTSLEQKNSSEMVKKPVDSTRSSLENDGPNRMSNSFDEAVESIYDPCPSVRAAGLRYVATSMKKNVAEVTKLSEKLIEILLEALLKESDSFVYLSAIQALVETINRAPVTSNNTRTLFCRLMDEYEKHSKSQDSDVELKISKLGEVIVRIVVNLGEFADYQSSKLLPVLFRGARDPRGPIRCSCISNLAELCPLLRHKVATFQYELCECICATVLHDHDVTVRRAAVHLMRKLIETLNSDILHIFADSMKKFYSSMKRCYQDDPDHVVQLHAQLALEALDDVMRDVMFNEPERKSKSLQKKITVLP